MEFVKKIRFLLLIPKHRKLSKEIAMNTLLASYSKLLFYLILEKYFGKGRKQETVFGFKIFFYDYETFVALFESIFIEHEYYFKSNKQSPRIIDLGSNIGLTVLYFKILYPKSEIQAFEPDPQTFEVLKKNVRINKIRNVKLFDIALSRKKGDAYFYIDSKNPGSLMMSLNKKRFGRNRIKVKTDLLSNYIPKQLDLLKMDVEGAEEQIIIEISITKALRKIKYMIFEYHHHIDLDQDSFSKTLRLLEREGFGYQIVSKLRSPIKDFLFQDILV